MRVPQAAVVLVVSVRHLALRNGGRGGRAGGGAGVHVGHEEAEEARALDQRLAALAADRDAGALDHDLRRGTVMPEGAISTLLPFASSMVVPVASMLRLLPLASSSTALPPAASSVSLEPFSSVSDHVAVVLHQQLGLAVGMGQADRLLAVLVVEAQLVATGGLQDARRGGRQLGIRRRGVAGCARRCRPRSAGRGCPPRTRPRPGRRRRARRTHPGRPARRTERKAAPSRSRRRRGSKARSAGRAPAARDRPHRRQSRGTCHSISGPGHGRCGRWLRPWHPLQITAASGLALSARFSP